MKKILLVSMLTLTLLCTGCVSDEDREKELLAAAEHFYDDCMSGIIGLDEAVITLDDIKSAKEEFKDEAYKIDTLEKCDAKKTKVILTLKDGKIESSKVELNCK